MRNRLNRRLRQTAISVFFLSFFLIAPSFAGVFDRYHCNSDGNYHFFPEKITLEEGYTNLYFGNWRFKITRRSEDSVTSKRNSPDTNYIYYLRLSGTTVKLNLTLHPSNSYDGIRGRTSWGYTCQKGKQFGRYLPRLPKANQPLFLQITDGWLADGGGAVFA